MIKKEFCSDTDKGINDFHGRRLFLKGMACSLAVAATGVSEVSSAATDWTLKPRKLAFYNLHTEEKLALTYFEQGRYVTGAVQELSYLLRDHRSGDAYDMDPELFDLLFNLQTILGGNKTFQVISAYRSPATNAMLNKQSSGVARKSMHMLGKAIDIRVKGVDSKVLQQASISLKRGGVGYYQQSDFVHIDTGKVRYW